MYVQREIENELIGLFSQYPVITLTGPRQSGKTTLLKNCFSNKKYFSLEDPEIRLFAQTDPVKFLKQDEGGMIIDEIQRIPELVSYIQGIVDKVNRPGMFILSGSQQFELTKIISQSLTGRTAILKLFPFSINEAYQQKEAVLTNTMIYNGFYPRIFSFELNPSKFYSNYLETYLRRDLSDFISVRDLNLFHKFLTLCAGRIGQLFEASSLANEVGVSVKTIQAWLSVLEASYLVYLLQPFHANINKRLTKSPKIYFYDTGLASYLLGINDPSQLISSPFRGSLFENLVIMEVKKHLANKGLQDTLCFYRDSHGNEVDLLHGNVLKLNAIEIKSAETFNTTYFKTLEMLKKLLPEAVQDTILCYDGNIEWGFKEHKIFNIRNFKI